MFGKKMALICLGSMKQKSNNWKFTLFKWTLLEFA